MLWLRHPHFQEFFSKTRGPAMSSSILYYNVSIHNLHSGPGLMGFIYGLGFLCASHSLLDWIFVPCLPHIIISRPLSRAIVIGYRLVRARYASRDILSLEWWYSPDRCLGGSLQCNETQRVIKQYVLYGLYCFAIGWYAARYAHPPALGSYGPEQTFVFVAAGSNMMALMLYAFNVQFGSTMAPEIVPCK